MKYILISAFLMLLGLTLSAQCIQLQSCPNNVQVCDNSNNNAQFWNASYWNDPVHNAQDLADALVDVNLLARDTCAGAALTMRYLLYLDLDRNGVWETVVKSWDPPAAGTVNYNNAGNPNFEGGEPREFDQRPVPAGQKYQFAMETIQAGDSTRAVLRWNTPDQPNVFVNVELPYATHKIKWEIADNQGNNSTCESSLIVKDCQNPTVVCLNGLAVNIMPTGLITLWAADFLQYGEDNGTPPSMLQYGLRKPGFGSGFPENPDGSPISSLTFDCNEIGTQTVDLWCRDASGNADYCQTYVIVQDNFNHCDGNGNNDDPTVVCFNGLTVNLLPSETVTLSKTDFLQYVTDDDTPIADIELSIRKCGTGTGFPVDGNTNPIDQLVFDCDELGFRCVELWAKDTSGNVGYCETYVIVQDNQGYCFNGGSNDEGPTIVCLNGLTVNIMPTGQIDMWDVDFLQYATDDDTPTNLLQLGIRKCSTGTGFPVDGNNVPNHSLTFDCDEIGTQCVELWARDTSGNANYCETYVIIQDNGNFCDPFQANITPCINSHCNNAPVHGALLMVNNWSIGAIGPLNGDGCAAFPLTSNGFLGNLNVAPANQLFPLNGVTVFDLIKIKRYILGLDTDLSPYQLLAADANKSGSITGFDLIELRKLLLGITTVLPNTPSWRFVDASFVFPNPANPFQTGIPESKNFPNAVAGGHYEAGFTAVKVGDLDCDAWTGLGAPSDSRDLPQQLILVPDMTLIPGAIIDVPVQLAHAGAWEGMQLALQFDPGKVEILDIQAGEIPRLDPDAYYQPQPGRIHLVWAQEKAIPLSDNTEVLNLRVRVKAAGSLSEAVQLASDFQQIGSRAGVPQGFALTFGHEINVSAPKEHVIMTPQPNPTNDGAIIPIQLAKQEKVVWQLSDLTGKTIFTQEQSFESGRQMLSIPAQALAQPGVYVWRVVAGEQTSSGKLMKM